MNGIEDYLHQQAVWAREDPDVYLAELVKRAVMAGYEAEVPQAGTMFKTLLSRVKGPKCKAYTHPLCPATIAAVQQPLFTVQPQTGFGPALEVLMVEYPPDNNKYLGPQSHWNSGIAVRVKCPEAESGYCWINVCRAGRAWAMPSTTLPQETRHPVPLGSAEQDRRPQAPRPVVPPTPAAPPAARAAGRAVDRELARNRATARDRTRSDPPRSARVRSVRLEEIPNDDL